MLLNAYCLYDSKACIYHVPFFAVNDNSAVRSFGDLAADMNTTVGRHPADFALWRIGTFDDQTSLVTAFHPPVFVINGTTVAPKVGTYELPFPPHLRPERELEPREHAVADLTQATAEALEELKRGLPNLEKHG